MESMGRRRVGTRPWQWAGQGARMRVARRLVRWGARALPACMLLATLGGCGAVGASTIQISGRVYGVPSGGGGTSHSAPIPLAASVTCNGVSAQASADGTFSLIVDASDAYQCTASALPQYAAATAEISGAPAAADITLDFGVTSPSSCAPDASGTRVECPPLGTSGGTLGGTITSGDAAQPAASVPVRCWQPSGAVRASTGNPTIYSTTTNSAGAYALHALPAGQYACVAGNDVALHEVTLATGSGGSLDFAICEAHCSPVTYHGGPVLHTLVAYLIFWLPRPYVYDSTGSPATFESIVERYFGDVGGTPFYGLLTQYWDYHGAIQNSATLGGTYSDTHPYPHAGTRADPLTDADIAAEVRSAMQANHWSSAPGHAFFVLTGYGAEICNDGAAKKCSFAQGAGAFCGYHSYIASDSLVYAEVPDVTYCEDALDYQASVGTNGNRIADYVVNYASHEQFEVVSDPLATGWYSGQDGDNGEIGDRCATSFGTIRPDRSTITLRGHAYLVQQEWSDQANACAFA